jgi:Natural resistance-associated macrophage protein
LLAYVGSAIVAKPQLWPLIKGTFVPSIHLNKEFLSILVAVIGTTLSAYLYSWQSNQDVEEDISMGRRRLVDRIGTSEAELRHSARDIGFGMFFASVVMYFIMLSTAATVFRAGHNHINTAAEAAQALRPVAGNLAGGLFALGVIGVGFLAVPIMTTGAAYDVCQTFGWKHGLHYPPAEAKKFNVAIAIFTIIAICLKFFGLQSHEGFGLGRDRAGILDSIPDAAGYADYDQSADHGKVGKHGQDERAGLGYDRRDVCGWPRPGDYVAAIARRTPGEPGLALGLCRVLAHLLLSSQIPSLPSQICSSAKTETSVPL